MRGGRFVRGGAARRGYFADNRHLLSEMRREGPERGGLRRERSEARMTEGLRRGKGGGRGERRRHLKELETGSEDR